MNQCCRHAEGAFKANAESFAEEFVEQVKIVNADSQVEHASVKVEQVVISELLNSPKVLHHLLDGQTV